MIKKIKYHIGNFMPALRSYNYRLYFIGQGISFIGTWFASIAEQWLIYPVLTKNQSLLGVVSAINTTATVLLVLFAGVIVDRVSRRKSIIVLQTMFGLISFLIFILVFTHKIKVWQVMLLTLITGILSAFDMPARNSMVLDFMDKKQYASALSLSSGMFNSARAIGPALAGFFIAIIGIAPAFLIDALSFLAVIICVLMMVYRENAPEPSVSSMFESFKEGARLVKHDTTVAILLLSVILMNLFTWPRATLLPVFANDIFKTKAVGFGLLQSFLGVGAALGAFSYFKLFEKVKNKFNLLIIPLIIISVTQILFATTNIFSFALIYQAMNGWAIATFSATANTIIQIKAPNNLRGRIMSFWSFALFAGMPFGGLIASLGVATIGARNTISVCGSFLALVGYLIFLKAQKGMKKDILGLEFA